MKKEQQSSSSKKQASSAEFSKELSPSSNKSSCNCKECDQRCISGCC